MFSLYRASVGLPRVMRMVVTCNRRINFSAPKVLCSPIIAEKRQREAAAEEREVRMQLSPSSESTVLLKTSVCEEDPAEQESIPGEPEDPLKQSLKAARSQMQLLEILEQKLHVMKPEHLLCCMHRFRNLTRRGEKFIGAQNPSFEMLSRKLLSRLRSYDVDQCVQLARIVANLELHCSSPLVQGIYKVLKRQQKKLDLVHMVHLHGSLSMLETASDVTEDFFRSLQSEFASKVGRDLGKMDEEIRLKALCFAVMVNIDRNTRDFVIDSTRELLPNATAELALHLVINFAFRRSCHLDPEDHKMHKVLKDCLLIVAKNMSWYDSKSLRRMMAAYSQLNLCQIEVHDAMWALAPIWSYDEIMRLVRLSLDKDAVSLENTELLRDLLVVYKEKLGTVADNGDVFRCSQMMAFLALHSPDVDSRIEEIGRLLATVLEREGLIQREPRVFVRFMLNLAILGVFPERELDLLFSEKLQRAVLNLSLPDIARFLDLERLLYLHFGDTCKYNAMGTLRKKVADLRRRTKIPADLMESVRSALGGDQFVLEHYLTPLGIEADLAVAMKHMKHPVAIANKQFRLKDLPNNTKMIAILPCILRRDICQNTGLSRVAFVLKQRFLQEQGISSIAIKMPEWNNLGPREKVQFIKDGIKAALEED